MKNIFNSIKLTKPKSSVFDLTHDVKLSLNMGDLVPIMCTECVPGDKFKIQSESLIRFAPLIAPVMHRFDVYMHYFFVPNRLVWPNWEKFITGNEDVLLPTVTYGDASYTKLVDYFGIPEGDNVENLALNAIPFAAYQCIYNEYYRDQNLITEVDYKMEDGIQIANAATLLTMRKRAWQHDYFTSSLPFAQKGAAVDIPLGTGVIELDTDYPLSDGGVFRSIEDGSTDTGTLANNGVADGITVGANPDYQVYDPQGSLIVETEPTTITDLRRAFKLQEWLEKNARGGTRYIENILVHFGVKSSDKRLQRPEYITGAKSPIVISEVLNTTGESAGLPQGNMAGHGVGVTSGRFGSYFCEEHGYIIGIMSVLPKTAYQQGVERHWLKVDKFDYYWPSFAHIGEQAVFNAEIFADTTNPVDTFGYNPRYSEYKYVPSRVAGQFRTSLNFWHMGRIFETEPALNQAFIECNPGKRIFAVTDENVDSIYAHVLNKVQAVRRMPKYGNPMM